MSPDLDLDPSDPLNLLLNNTSQNPEDDDESSDWSKFSTLWADPSVGLKPSCSDGTTTSLGFDDLGSLGMDMDFNPSMTIEPSALHYDYAKFAHCLNNYTANSFNNADFPSSQFHTSISSSSSSEESTPPPSTPLSSSPNQSTKLTTPNFISAESTSTASTPTTTAVPISALPRPKTSHTTIERRYRTNLNARIQSLRMAVPALRVLEDRECGKKIKKNVKGGVVVKGFGIGIIDSEDGSVVDVIDERGFVDGVKVARKCSKANVLGKAVEYIRVLKKREHRLRAEQAGLKSLISGLVNGGPALVEEWEREWKLKFGGEEQDEVEGEGEDGDDEDSEDDEGEEEELGKKRKRAKTSPTPKVSAAADRSTKKSVSPVVGPNDQVPEKRKRGRPRKVLPSTAAVPVAPRSSDRPISLTTKQDETMHQQPLLFNNETQWLQHQQPQPQQFLLAVFALFSFFNSPLTSSYSTRQDHHHSHTGTVLNALHPPLAYAPDIISQFAAPSPPNNTSPAWTWQNYIQVFHLLVSVLVLASFVGSWFGISFGFGFNKKAVSVRGSLRDGDTAIRRQGAVDWVKMGEQSVAEGKAASLSLYERARIYRSVSRKSETSVSDLATLALVARSTTGVFSGLGRMKGRSIWGIAQDLASGTHPKPPTLKINEKLVFETLSIDEASDRLALASASRDTWTKERENEDGRLYTPLEVLGCLIVRERVKKHMGRLFVQVVAANATERVTMVNDDECREEIAARRMTVDAARELGGSVERLGKAFERVWKTTISFEDDELLYLGSESAVDQDDEINALFTALVLYRRAFGATTIGLQHPCDPSSTLLSPPPSPTMRESVKYAQMLLELRKALGNRVFEDDDNNTEGEGEGDEVDMEGAGGYGSPVLRLEDARDRVVDIIVDVERRGKRAVSMSDTPF